MGGQEQYWLFAHSKQTAKCDQLTNLLTNLQLTGCHTFDKNHANVLKHLKYIQFQFRLLAFEKKSL